MKFKPKLSLVITDKIVSFRFFEALDTIARTRSQREAAKVLGISHAVLNRRIRETEDNLNIKIVITTAKGSEITDDGLKILKQYHYLMKRLSTHDKPVICGGYISAGLLEVLTVEFGLDALVYQTDDESALYLYDRGMVDILTLDDPVKAFMRDLDFIPLARDHLVLVSSSDEIIQDLSELEGKNFLEISGSAQRLAWNTLDNNEINYKIVKLLKSPYEALKMVKNSDNLYTFINNSLTSGCDLLKDDTNHLLTLVLFDQENEELNDLIEFIRGRGRKIIKELGFKNI
ncbi:MAG: LysR family transcriptional regulator [Methanobacterium sp.]|nr:LysR family transcriptional regulator [Methanobacterium sp.]